ncbi:hypothetical protein EVAR_81245_1 [Eumeta japonica]|uniref:Uncharacterized protein n=1 Tax=Eumeta variegata TaxID=151549 RepID=A0A4C1V0Y3_EUMVA|nr:hypothetical protein EVAR_81245_1 [Eumeta japonica]
MAFWRRGVIIRKLLPLRYRAVSSAKSASWTPVCGCGIRSCTRGKAARGECGALRNSGSYRSFGRYAFFMPEGELSVRQVMLDDEDETIWDLQLVTYGCCYGYKL